MTGLQETAPIGELRRPGLGEVIRLFDALHAGQIRYCHWKSNAHLTASLWGRTDLDVLVDRRATQSLARLLGQTTFQQFRTVPQRGYPGVESYIGLDPESGALLHLHLHYQLTLGEVHLKGYRLPWEEVLLSTRVMDEAHGLYTADPNLEFLLLVVRTALKLRLRDLVSAGVGRPYVRGNVLAELEWLAARVDADRLAGFGRELLGEQAAELLVKLADVPRPTVGQLAELRRSTTPSLSEYRTYSRLGARVRRWGREGRRRLGDASVRALGITMPTRRRPQQGGLLVVFLGADGSGKSTLAREISRWLAPLIDVTPIYFGSGQGPATLPRHLLEAAASLARRTKASAAPAPGLSRGSGSSTIRTIGELLWVLALSRERRQRAATARRALNLGMIVLCDRFPQSQHAGNDGPYLGHWMTHPSRMRRAVAQDELAAIQTVERLRPDLVLKLRISPDVALQRKPETPPVLLHMKLRVLEQLRFPLETRVLEIDATRPLDQVLLEAKRAIWSSL